MTVVLKKQYQNDLFIIALNAELEQKYGADSRPKFNPTYYVRQDADYFNSDPVGILEAPHIKRPITEAFLRKNFYWYRYGTFSFKLSDSFTVSEAKDAIAVAKWIMATNGKYINSKCSRDYTKDILDQYLLPYSIDLNVELESLWA